MECRNHNLDGFAHDDLPQVEFTPRPGTLPSDRTKGLAFVATNSITQGEQVAQLWPLLFQRYGLEIHFAHRTFAWGSDARGKAHVHVVIVGLVKRANEPKEKRLFSYPDVTGEPVESNHPGLSPYLVGFAAPELRHVVVAELSEPISARPRMRTGCQPIDDGNYLFSKQQRDDFLATEPQATTFFRPYMSGNDFLQDECRWVLALQNIPPSQLRGAPRVLERIQNVREFRLKSDRSATRALAEAPTRFNVEVLPTQPFLALPEVSSENRQFLPVGWIEPPTIPSNKLRFIENAKKWELSLLTSSMHMAWMRTVTGRLESRYMYSVGVVYNTFPWPDLDDTNKTKLSQTGQAILDARANHDDASLADLYDPDAMPLDLRNAHRENDRIVDRMYRKIPFNSERERVEFLFARYDKLRTPLIETKAKKKP